jgi:hypothetical protein
MPIQVSTPTSAAELRALYRRTRAHFALAPLAPPPSPSPASPPAARPAPAAAPPARIVARPARRPRACFSGRATLNIVARHFGLQPAAIAGTARRQRLVVARWIVMHICFAVGGYSATQAGRLLGRNHCTVIYGRRELAALLARDAKLAADVANLAQQCVRGVAPATAGEGGA